MSTRDTLREVVLQLAKSLEVDVEVNTNGLIGRTGVSITSPLHYRFTATDSHLIRQSFLTENEATLWAVILAQLTQGTEPCYDARDAECVERECFDEDERAENLELNRLAEMDEDADRQWRMHAETERDNQ